MLEFALPIAAGMNVRRQQVEAVLELFAEGATIPFIARYRKDRTGGLDEVQIARIQDESRRLQEMAERRAFILKTIAEQGKLTDELKEKIERADSLAVLEDIYLPYKPKRRTRAQIARENGLEPLAQHLLQQEDFHPYEEAAKFVNEQVSSADDALQGARDIIAEMINEDAEVRAGLRRLFEEEATLQSRVVSGKETEGVKFKDYFEFSESISRVPSHRILAVLRGFVEGVLRLVIAPAAESALIQLEDKFVRGGSRLTDESESDVKQTLTISEYSCSDHVRKAVKDAYNRLLQPSLESEFRTLLKQRADEEAINVFAENLRQLLLSSPLGGKRLLAIDPGYRTGCKTVVLNERGDLLKTDLIFVHEAGKLADAEYKVRHLCQQYQVEAIAVGDGTAGRETEQFVRKLGLNLPVFLVNEDGASVYSASEIAREEFPQEDVTVRGAVSIGRRLMDPLAELVKIDPKSIGVGQYQHDVNQFRLKEKLDQTVESCVNQVGVDLNTASRQLLSYVSGIGSGIAENIVKYRAEHGEFRSRRQLLQIPRLGAKAFEQCAGFLRIRNGEHPLDASAVHPEAYEVVEKMASDLQVDMKQLIGNETLISSIDARKYVTDAFGELTLKDILQELRKPGRDPRSEAQQFEFANVFSIEELQVGMIIPGIVTNLTRFGAFVDIGVKQDGLVHVSEIAHKFIADPAEALKLNQQVQVKVLEVDVARKRIALSIKQTQEAPRAAGRQGRGAASQGIREPRNTGLRAPAGKEVTMDDALAALKKKFSR